MRRHRGPIIRQMFEKTIDENWSGRRVFKWLKDDLHFTTRYGKGLTLGNIYRLLRSPFYTGIFEYPKGSGKWYTGKHEPIISKELFDKVQEKLNEDNNRGLKGKEFAFTKILHCGLCGSGITAEEKFKKLKDGGLNRHVYYRCTKSKNIDCKNEPLNETQLIEQALGIIDTIDIDKIGLKEKLSTEIERYTRFQHGVLGIEKEIIKKKRDIDIRNYAKYLLKEGSLFEQREILLCIKGKLLLKAKKITSTN